MDLFYLKKKTKVSKAILDKNDDTKQIFLRIVLK